MSVLDFPLPIELKVIDTAARNWLFSRDPETREQLGGSLRWLMQKYGVNRVTVNGMVVTEKNGRVRVDSKRYITGSSCECGEHIYTGQVKILHIQEKPGLNLATYGCQKCGRIFAKREEVGLC